eukprot:GGOE01001392.1.p1 GENE.GGOE01001392.1~~GGOE01001392.1.p1  ORF type:complete len:756 (-),score=237.28 GGOE01001392.1:118-2385(-)
MNAHEKLAARLEALRDGRKRTPKEEKFRPKKKHKQEAELKPHEDNVPEYSAAAAARTAKALADIAMKQEQEKSQPPPSEAEAKPSAPKKPSSKSAGQPTAPGEAEQQQSGVTASATMERYTDFGGLKAQLDEVRRLIEFPLRYPQVFDHLGADPPCGVLLHGPPGCGKTRLAHAVAGELGVPFYKVAAPEVVAGISGESEQKVRSLFSTAMAQAPCIVFIDEIDAIAGKRESALRDMERRIVAQLLTCMDELSLLWRDHRKICIVIGATNRPDSLDSALRRAGRFDREISISIPNLEARVEILEVLTRKLKLEGTIDLKSIAFRTPGFVGADLHALTKEACAIALRRIFNLIMETASHAAVVGGGPAAPATEGADGVTGVAEDAAPPPPTTVLPTSLSVDVPAEDDVDDPVPHSEADAATQPAAQPASSQPFALPVVDITPEMLERCSITMADFDQAVGLVQPSAMREGFTTVPAVTWDDVGALEDVKQELIDNISRPIMRPDVFRAMGCLNNPIGVLLYGPPGCGKTLVAKAIANESGANFISIKGPELLNKYMGESERSVRTVFARAQASAPCILFFDELDALAPKRGNESGNQAAERVVNQLLTELDGVKGRQDVYVIGASNRIDMIDPAMLRPGRLDKLLYVPLPDATKRLAILQKQARGTPVHPAVDLAKFAYDERCEGFSGADCAALVREAAIAAVTDFFRASDGADDAMTTPPQVLIEHFEIALQKVKPSVSAKDRARYEKMRAGIIQ